VCVDKPDELTVGTVCRDRLIAKPCARWTAGMIRGVLEDRLMMLIVGTICRDRSIAKLCYWTDAMIRSGV